MVALLIIGVTIFTIYELIRQGAFDRARDYDDEEEG